MNKVERKYICIRDLQGGSFAVGRVQTAEDWRRNALEWCEQDDNEEYARFIKKLPKKNIVGEIASMWDLAIVPIEDLPIEEMWELLRFMWWTEISLNKIKQEVADTNDKEILEKINDYLKDINEKVGNIW